MRTVVQSACTVVFFESPHRIRATLEEIRAALGDIDVLLARELTKIHEQLVRSQISTALAAVTAPVGEFVVALRPMNSERQRVESPDAAEIVAEFMALTRTNKALRRAALRELGLKYGRTTKSIYDLVVASKKPLPAER
jgi:16S rRNA (cytidine1402-2'-O)-methyltransferase